MAMRVGEGLCAKAPSPPLVNSSQFNACPPPPPSLQHIGAKSAKPPRSTLRCPPSSRTCELLALHTQLFNNHPVDHRFCCSGAGLPLTYHQGTRRQLSPSSATQQQQPSRPSRWYAPSLIRILTADACAFNEFVRYCRVALHPRAARACGGCSACSRRSLAAAAALECARRCRLSFAACYQL